MNLAYIVSVTIFTALIIAIFVSIIMRASETNIKQVDAEVIEKENGDKE